MTAPDPTAVPTTVLPVAAVVAADPVGKLEASIIAKQPVLAGFLGSAVAGAAAVWSTAHFGTDQDTVRQIVEPVVTGGVLTFLGFLIRELVTPTFKVAARVEAEVEKRLNAAPGIH